MKESQTYDRKSIRTVTGKTADFDEIAKDCVAFANRDGGHLDIKAATLSATMTRASPSHQMS